MKDKLLDLARSWREQENGRYGLDEYGSEIYVLSGRDCANQLEEFLKKEEDD